MSTNNRETAVSTRLRVFGTTRIMILAALFTAMSIVFDKFLAVNIGDSIRIGLGGLPLQMAGIMLGPVVGAAVGGVSDIIGCLLKGYSINPVITLGAVSVGFLSGLMYHKVLAGMNKASLPRIALSTLTAHAVGSMLIKSVGMFVYFHTPMQTLVLRVPIYIVTAAIETAIIFVLMQNKGFMSELERIRR